MAVFPSVMFSWRDLSEAPDPVVLRTEMERGPPKQRRVNSDARVQIELKLFFDTKAQAAAFETWFFTDIKGGQDFFDMTHPVTGAAIQARVVGGRLGPKSFVEPTRERCSRTLQIEYWRSTW